MQWKPSKPRPLLEHVKAPGGISIVFCPGITGEALKWNSIVDPPPLTLSAGIPLTVKTLGDIEPTSTKPLMETKKSVSWVKTVLLQAGWESNAAQGASLGVGVGL